MAKASKKNGNKLGPMISTGVAEAPPPYKGSAEDKKRELRYRAEEDLRTLQRAQEIHRDRQRVSMCKSVANEQIKALKGVAGTKGRR